MSKINQIQSALKAIDQARFQQLCDHYLHKQGYVNINSIGLVIGKDKTKTGTPDTYISLTSGKYLFAEYTTQQEGVVSKFEDDLAKCFDSTKTGLSDSEIEKVFLCYNGQMDVRGDQRLKALGAKHGCIVEIIGIGRLSHDLKDKYPDLAKEHLNVDVDSGQILDEERFIAMYQKHPNATRIDTVFLGRESDLELAHEFLLSNNVLLISGRPGVGKTRFALECCRRFAGSHSEYRASYVFNRSADVYDDVRTYFSQPGKYLIMIDDANRRTGLTYFLELLQEQSNDREFKIVCTVRDYAAEKIRSDIGKYARPDELEINPFSNDEIKELVRVSYNIQNGDYLRRIERLAQGNPRLAMMAAKVATEHNSLGSIDDVSALYDEYFKSIRGDMEGDDFPGLLRAAAAVTFFRGIDRDNDEQKHLILDAFGLDNDSFWSYLERLHELEIVDLWEDHSIARIADQVLATYLFYRAVFVDKVIDLTFVLTKLFPRFRSRLMDAVSPVYSAFDVTLIEKVLKPSILNVWGQFTDQKRWDELWELMEAFWWVNENQTLIIVRDSIRSMESELIDVASIEWKTNSFVPRSTPLSVLSQFRGSVYQQNAAKLILDYAAKQPSAYPYVIHILTDDYGFRTNSHRYGYATEKMVLDVIWAEWESTKRFESAWLYVAVVNEFIKTHHMATEPLNRRALTIMQFDLLPTEEMQAMRRMMLKQLLELYERPELVGSVTALLHQYPRMGCDISGKGIIGWDMEILLPFVRSHLDPAKYSDCRYVQSLLAHCRRNDVEYDQDLKTIFTNQTYELSILLTDDYEELQEYGHDHYRERKRDAIRQQFSLYTAHEYRVLLQQCQEVLAATSRQYQILEGIGQILLDLLNRDPTLFEIVMAKYLDDGDSLTIHPDQFVGAMMTAFGAKRTHDVVEYATSNVKDKWLFSYFSLLPETSITASEAEQLKNLYAVADVQVMPYRLAYLERFSRASPTIANDIVTTLLRRSKEDKRYIFCFSKLFLLAGENQEAMLLRTLDIDNIETAYIEVASIERHLDYQCRAMSLILDRDPAFLNKYIHERHQVRKDHYWPEERDYSLLWERDDYRAIIKSALDEAFGLDKKDRFFLSDTRDRLLTVSRLGNDERRKPCERVISLLEEIIEEHYSNREYMEFLSDGIARFDEDTHRRLLAFFLLHNKNPEDFQKLWLEPSSGSASGSWVPVYTRQKEFLQSLFSLVADIDLLDHRAYLEHRIEILEQQIEREKRSDFLEE
ncbi:MAG: hypothetical protein JWQ98_1268 [Chlorobi bacterium]|nr:hypothetical protein [Chlorobiota bacterium]